MVFIRFYRSGRSLEMSGSQNPSDLSKTLPDPLWRKDPGVRVSAYPTLALILAGVYRQAFTQFISGLSLQPTQHSYNVL